MRIGLGCARARAGDPEQEAVLADSVGVALLVVLETLTPTERLAFVLHNLFGMSFDDIAAIVGRSPAAAHQRASRALAGSRRAPSAPVALALVNGRVGVVVAPRGRLSMVIDFEIRGGKIAAIDVVADPERLRRLDVAFLD